MLAFFSLLVYNENKLGVHPGCQVTHKGVCSVKKQQAKTGKKPVNRSQRPSLELVSSNSKPALYDDSCIPTFSQNPPRRSLAHALSPGMKENESPGSRL